MINTMHKKADLKSYGTHLAVIGEMDFSNITALYKKGVLELDQRSEIIFDFSQVTSTNSAGLALLVEWVKFAHQRKKSIQFKNLSLDLIAIAKIAGVDRLLGI